MHLSRHGKRRLRHSLLTMCGILKILFQMRRLSTVKDTQLPSGSDYKED